MQGTGSTSDGALPGFNSPESQIFLASVTNPIVGEDYIVDKIPIGLWNQLTYTFDLVVPPGRTLYRQSIAVLRIMESGGFSLPETPLLPNDPRLTIACIKNQMIFEEPIKNSPRVVDRTFLTSRFQYFPPQKESIFLLVITLEPTVNITEDNPVIFDMPGFRNSLSKRNIHIKGNDGYRFASSIGEWNETTSQLTLRVPEDNPIHAFTVLNLEVQESQGFILPAALNANDTRIHIRSENNIPKGGQVSEPIKESPMVGNGPYTGHRFCMLQYERGVRTRQPICTAAADCEPALTDPCSTTELER